MTTTKETSEKYVDVKFDFNKALKKYGDIKVKFDFYKTFNFHFVGKTLDGETIRVISGGDEDGAFSFTVANNEEAYIKDIKPFLINVGNKTWI